MEHAEPAEPAEPEPELAEPELAEPEPEPEPAEPSGPPAEPSATTKVVASTNATEAGSPPDGWATSIDLVTRLVPIGALMLPVTGALFRWAAFSVGDPVVPPVIAAAMPIGDLAAVGLSHVGTQVAGVFLLAILSVFFYSPSHGPTTWSFRGRWRRLFLGLLVIVYAALGLLIATSLVELASFVVSLALGAGIGFYIGRSPRPIPLRRVFIATAAGSIAIGSLTGLRPNDAGTFPVAVDFASTSPLPDGDYIQLGEDDRGIWLLRCGVPDARALLVDASDVASRTVGLPGSRGPRRTFFDTWLAGHPTPAGFVPPCP